MERLTTRDKIGVATMRSDLPPGQGNNLIARLAAYEDSGIDPEMVAVIGWIGKTVWMLGWPSEDSELRVIEGHVTQVFFGGRITPKVEVMVGCLPITDLEPENIYLSREDAETALAQLMEREARR